MFSSFELHYLTILIFSTRQINQDCEFLETEKIMDYSLLVGVHFRDDNNCEKMGLSPFLLRSGNMLTPPFQRRSFVIPIDLDVGKQARTLS